jgi:hypothetical protein
MGNFYGTILYFLTGLEFELARKGHRAITTKANVLHG